MDALATTARHGRPMRRASPFQGSRSSTPVRRIVRGNSGNGTKRSAPSRRFDYIVNRTDARHRWAGDSRTLKATRLADAVPSRSPRADTTDSPSQSAGAGGDTVRELKLTTVIGSIRTRHGEPRGSRAIRTHEPAAGSMIGPRSSTCGAFASDLARDISLQEPADRRRERRRLRCLQQSQDVERVLVFEAALLTFGHAFGELMSLRDQESSRAGSGHVGRHVGRSDPAQ